MNVTKIIAKILLKIKAVVVRTNPPFTWNTGLVAPIYCDHRLLLSYPSARKIIVKNFKKLVKAHRLKFDIIAGTATAGIPWAAFLAAELNKPMIYVRSHPKDYGTAKCVEGYLPTKAKVLVVEDLISTGRSSLATITACRKEAKATIVATVAIFNYQMNEARLAYAKLKIPFYTLTNFSALLSVAEEQKYITAKQKTIALAWGANPSGWWKKYSQQ